MFSHFGFHKKKERQTSQLTPAQKLIQAQAQELINYLLAVSDAYFKKTNQLWDFHTINNGRLFSTGPDPAYGVALPMSLNDLFHEKKLISEFSDRFKKFQPELTLKSVNYVKNEFIDYFFGPIQATDAWKNFVANFEFPDDQFPNDEKKQCELQNRINFIMSTFIFKMESAHSKSKHTTKEEAHTKDVLAKIINFHGLPFGSLQESFQFKARAALHGKLNVIKESVRSGQTKSTKLKKLLLHSLEELKDNTQFQAYDAKELLILDELRHFYDHFHEINEEQQTSICSFPVFNDNSTNNNDLDLEEITKTNANFSKNLADNKPLLAAAILAYISHVHLSEIKHIYSANKKFIQPRAELMAAITYFKTEISNHAQIDKKEFQELFHYYELFTLRSRELTQVPLQTGTSSNLFPPHSPSRTKSTANIPAVTFKNSKNTPGSHSDCDMKGYLKSLQVNVGQQNQDDECNNNNKTISPRGMT